MSETVAMLEARLALIARLHRVEVELARDEHARAAADLLRGRSHDLGNDIQIMRLSSLVLESRLASADPDLVELVTDLRGAAEHATAILADLFAAARMPDRTAAGAPVAAAVRASVELVRPALAAALDLHVALADDVRTRCTAEELEAIVVASVLDASAATRVTLTLRERTLAGARWVELLRTDDRPHGDHEPSFERPSLLAIVEGIAKGTGGELTLSQARGGCELALALPVAVAQSSSSS